ncbi:glycoside hydrolase family 2 TIM barrel-domain containing protein [Dolosigranulum savutiense]|uniref:Glycoside hydrolase family 2 TIM barrel-domain containing protein n=1 Tax=Dolosigranulum savutiense TaxID=3110288 RepID=A0AB74U409_9LACT
MFSKNNHQMKNSDCGNKQKKYSLRKLSVGLVSVSLGIVLYTGNAVSVSAEEVNDEVNVDEGVAEKSPTIENTELAEVSSDANPEEVIDIESAVEKAVETIESGAEGALEKLTEEIEENNQLVSEDNDNESSSDEELDTIVETSSNEVKTDESDIENIVDDEIKYQKSTEQKRINSSEAREQYVQLVGENERKVLFSSNWRVQRGENTEASQANFDDKEWNVIDLPHDYSIDQEFSTQYEAESGFLPGGVSWYRKDFVLPNELKNKNVTFHLEGAYMNTEVYVNSHKVGEHHHGYTGAAFDITKYLNTDGKTRNVIAVRTENKVPTSRWYSGSGIYRDVNLMVTDKLHVDHYGVKIEANNLEENHESTVTTTVKTTVINNHEEAKDFTVEVRLLDKDGQQVANVQSNSLKIEVGQSMIENLGFNVETPTLWSIDNPYLYKVETLIKTNDTVIDRVVNDFGYRFFKFDADEGFSLNGKNIKLKGVNMHHDQGALGAVANPAAMERQVQILKKMGANAIRTSHNPVSPALIDIANRYGVLVIEESFDGWHRAKNGNVNDYSNYFDQAIGEENEIIHGRSDMTWAEYDLKEMIRKSQNAPSVIMWSLGNEISEGAGGAPQPYINHGKNLVKWAREIDQTRPLTFGDNRGNLEYEKIHEEIIKYGGVVGFNYRTDAFMKSLKDKHPAWPLMMSETGSAIHSRSWYSTYGRDNQNLHMSAYDTDEAVVGWGASASESWRRVIENDFIAGEFVWTGFDYLGEPTPWNGIGQGSVSGQGAKPNSSFFGIVDTAGFPKDTYYLYHSMWNDQEDTLHLMPTWNKENLVVDNQGHVKVDVFTNAAKVELYLNGEKVAEDTSTLHTTDLGYSYRRFTSTNNKKPYATFNIKHEPGELSVRAWDEEGNEITENAYGRKLVETYGKPAALKASGNKEELTADGRDLLYVEVDVVDEEGRLVDNATDRVNFEVVGEGKLVGVDNGNQADTDSYKGNTRTAFGGKVLAIIQATNRAGSITVNVTGEGLEGTSLTVNTKAKPSNDVTFLRSYHLADTFYTQAGQPVALPNVISGTFSNAESRDIAIEWDEIDQSQYENTGTFEITGRLVDYDTPIKTTVSVLNKITAIENYATALSTTQTLRLPETRRGYNSLGEFVTVPFAVTWQTDDIDISQPGDYTIKGTADVFGQDYEVEATIRVVEAVSPDNIASANYHNTPTFKNGYVKDGIPIYTERMIWGNYTTLNDGDYEGNDFWGGYINPTESFLELNWTETYSIQNLRLWHYADHTNAALPGPENMRFEYLDETDNQWKEIGFSNITQTVHTAGNTPYAFVEPVRTSRLRIFMKSSKGKAPALTGIEVDEFISAVQKSSSTELETVNINGQDIAVDSFVNNRYFVQDTEITEVKATSKDNAAVTIAEDDENSYIIRVVSEDEKQVTEYFIKHGKREETPTEEEDKPEVGQQLPTVEEDKVTGTNIVEVDKFDWIDTSSEQTTGNTSVEGPLELAFDKNPNTFWHSAWDKKDSGSYSVYMRLKEADTIRGLRYVPRQDVERNGIATKYILWAKIGPGEDDWVGKRGEWSLDREEKFAYFDQTLRTDYVVFELLEGYAGYGTAAEMELLRREIKPDLVETETESVIPHENSVHPDKIKNISASSEQLPGEPTEGSIHLAFDGKEETFWHTDWNKKDTFYTVDIELTEPEQLTGFGYVPRQDYESNGLVTKYEIHAKLNGKLTKVSEGNWANNREEKIIAFENPIETDYVQFKVLAGNAGFGTAAELKLLKTIEQSTEEQPPVEADDRPMINRTHEEKLNAMKGISVDAGRKYYSVDQLKDIIDVMSTRGYTDLQLMLGNDGLRFVLDDMTITTESKTYDSNKVKEAIKKGNKKYYDDPNGNVLTQADMQDILDYAKAKGIRIVPGINSPGHMDAMLDAMKLLGIENPNYSYRGSISDRTIDLNNEEAVEFTKELIKAYATFFSGQTDLFNIGLDEYANDLFKTGGMGWGHLQSTGQYDKFIEYTNELARIVKSKHMKPVAFNDGIYFNNVTDQGTIDTDIIVSYWTGGWNGFNTASSKLLADKGHDIINLNDHWYYVIGRENENAGYYNLDQGLQGMNNVPFDLVLKNEGEPIQTIGSMIAAWADEPRVPFIRDNFVKWLDTFFQNNKNYFRADYSVVHLAIQNIPEDLSKYTDESVQALKDAKEAVDWQKSANDQGDVNEYINAIVNAIEGLVEKPVDESTPTPDPEGPGTGEDDEEIESGQPTPPIEEEQPKEVIKDYFKLIADFDGEQVVYDRKDSDVWSSAEQARKVYDQYLSEVVERDGKEYKRVDVTFTQSDEEAILTYVYRTDDYEPTPEPQPEIYAGDYEFELTLDGELSTETLTFASRDKALDFVATLNRLYKAAGYQLITQDNGLPGEYKISLSFEKIVEEEPEITPEDPTIEDEPEVEEPGTETDHEEEEVPEVKEQPTPEPEQPTEPEVTPEELPDLVEASFIFTSSDGTAHRGSLGEFSSLEQAERRIRHYANELNYTLQNFRLVDGVFLADIEADLSEPLPESEQPEEQPIRDVEANFEFTLENGSVHRGSLGEFTSLEQAERRIRHFANKQGYTLHNFRIENEKFIADVTEVPQAASMSVWTLGVIGVTSIVSVLKNRD